MAEWKIVSWSPIDIITDEKLDAMVSNDNWLKDNMPSAQYNAYGLKRTTGVKFLSGIARIAASKSNVNSVSVDFGGIFTASCRPIVTTGINSTSQRMVYVTFDGPGSEAHASSRGFQLTAYVDSVSKVKKITRNIYVNWIAIGY